MILKDLKNMELPDDALDNVNGGIKIKGYSTDFGCTNETQAIQVITVVQAFASDIYASVYDQLKAAKTADAFGSIIKDIPLIDSISDSEIQVLYDCFKKNY